MAVGPRHATASAQITTSGGTTVEVDHVVSALPSAALARLLGAPEDALVASVLEAMETVDVAVVNVAYRERCLPMDGFGYLVPSWEPSDVLGVIFDSSAFPEQNRSERIGLAKAAWAHLTQPTRGGACAASERLPIVSPLKRGLRS